jgi:uncharacterized protein YqgC (DUF456 family)
MESLILGAVLLASLFLIPLGLPGLWVMLGAGLLHQLLVPASGIGMFTLLACVALVVVAEILEWTLSARYTRRYGGSKRAGWGAIIGGLVGAVMGVPVPIIGSVIGAFLGSFLGALVFELGGGAGGGAATRVAWGALVGRVVSSATKVGVGVVVAAWLMAAAAFG